MWYYIILQALDLQYLTLWVWTNSSFGPTLSYLWCLFGPTILLGCSKGYDPVGNVKCIILVALMRGNKFDPFTSLQGIPICMQICESKKRNTNWGPPIRVAIWDIISSSLSAKYGNVDFVFKACIRNSLQIRTRTRERQSDSSHQLILASILGVTFTPSPCKLFCFVRRKKGGKKGKENTYLNLKVPSDPQNYCVAYSYYTVRIYISRQIWQFLIP